jgi:hypothetical protein
MTAVYARASSKGVAVRGASRAEYNAMPADQAGCVTCPRAAAALRSRAAVRSIVVAV